MAERGLTVTEIAKQGSVSQQAVSNALNGNRIGKVKVVPAICKALDLSAKDNEGIIWVGVKSLCVGMGLTRGQLNGEVAKIQEDMVLSQGCMKFRAGVFEPNNETLALQLDYVPLWLAKISITPNMRKNHPELVEKLVNYQLKAKDALAAAFLLDRKYWEETRQEAKKNRLLETDAIKEFVAYAERQGSQHANMYYYHLTDLANKAAGTTEGRDSADVKQLNNLTLIEHIIYQSGLLSRGRCQGGKRNIGACFHGRDNGCLYASDRR